ncbi:hypothetical protein BJ165DRAFT_226436 [Panaeolus papilionaceus]|nr:hypothetical protein BJ165DRAFT_226436 [Panaeolus papilionaceus]
MPPIRTQPLIHGSNPSPLSRSTTFNGPYLRSPSGHPDIQSPSGEVSEARFHPDSLARQPGIPSTSNLLLNDGDFYQSTHVQGAYHGSTSQDPHPTMFGSNSRFLVNGGNPAFHQHSHVHQAHHTGGIQILYQHSSPGAAYNSRDRYDPPKCHPNTRTGLLNTTREWEKKGPSEIMWLYGSAGAGKSAVAQTMCMEFRARSNLAASFFFSRTAPLDSHRGHEGRFVTTIACQLVEVVPGLQRYVEQVVLNRPLVFDLTLSEQVTALIIDPLKELQLEWASHGSAPCMLPKVIVVDGLDECKEESRQTQVLEAIATLVGSQEVFPCSVFLASRPELVIRSWITTKQSENPHFLRTISLLDHCDSNKDIEVFVNDEAAKVRQSHPFKDLIPAGWPSPEFIKEIVRRASGQFIYASTIMKYIKDLRGNPSDRLAAILCNAIPSYDRPYAELDALYLHILRQTQHPNLVQKILAFCVSTANFSGRIDGIDSRTYLQILLSLPLPVHTLLIDLQSIMTCDRDVMRFRGSLFEIRPYPALFHHASLLEFLLDPSRSEEFYVDIPRFDKELCEITLRHLGESGPAVADEKYILYCFLILLQTRTSCHSSYRDEVITQLARWDDLNAEMLYVTLCRLSWKADPAEDADKLVDITDRNLWTAFAPAVARMRAQSYQKFVNAGLPQELFVMYRAGLLGLYFTSTLDRDLPSNASARESFRWYIMDCIQHRTGVDAWHFCSLMEHQFLMNEYWEPRWHSFMQVLDRHLPASEKQTLQIEKLQQDALSEWKALVPAVAVFLIKHLISMLENEAMSDHVKEKGGDNWRAFTAAVLLHDIGTFIWRNCPISAEIVSALEEISQKFFPPHVVSTMEDTTFPFDFPRPEFKSRKELLHSFSSPCALPRWFFTPPNLLRVYGGLTSRTSLGYLHDYVRLSIICTSADPCLEYGFGFFGRSWYDNPDKWYLNIRYKIYDPLGVGACGLAGITTDPRTGLPINLEDWSLQSRWLNFNVNYERAKEEHAQMKKQDPQLS